MWGDSNEKDKKYIYIYIPYTDFWMGHKIPRIENVWLFPHFKFDFVDFY